MDDAPRFQNRRHSIRLKRIFPAVYTRFDNQGRPCDQKISRSMDMSLGGVRLQSSFPVDSGEILEITIALAESLVTLLGKVVYVIPFQDEVFEMGISIKEIKDPENMKLSGFSQRMLESGLYRDNAIIRMGQIICPSCGERIAGVARVKDMIAYCKEFFGQCSCGQKYTIRLSYSNNAVLSFPDRQIEILC